MNRPIVVFAFLWAALLGPAAFAQQNQTQDPSFAKAFEGKFHIGTALNTPQITKRDTASLRVIRKHFNAIVAENIMKSGLIQPEEGKFNWELADQFVALGEELGYQINGHTLIWHSQAPRWFFTGADGKEVSKEVLIDRMKTHIHTVVGRYKGRIHTWDVVNETILDDGSWRQSKFYEIIGEDFVKLAFQFAHEADPDAFLLYNDYSMALPGKREGVVNMVKRLQEQGVKIDGIGMQGHVGLDHPTIEEFEKSLLAFAGLGVKVSITELDLSVLPSPNNIQGAEVSTDAAYEEKMNPYKNGLPADVEKAFEARYMEFFRLFDKHHDKISRVTFWGVADQHSWKNNWPVRGRTDYTLLFDRQFQPKAVVKDIIELGYHN
jgi:endo-1,4-beta-xylanase